MQLELTTRYLTEKPQSIAVFNADYITKALNFYGISAVFKNEIDTAFASVYNYDLTNMKDIFKIDKVLKILSALIGTNVVKINTYKYHLSIGIYYTGSILYLKRAIGDITLTEFYEAIIGQNIYGDKLSINFKNASHLLISGTTGSGKSVAVNSIITSLLITTPKVYFDLYLFDCKQVELSAYKSIAKAFITDVDNALITLEYLCDLMDWRYARMNERNIKKYDGKHIFIIVDELADLMLTSRYEIEPYLVRLAQKSRACNMHLILATQRPSVNVITGLLKANIANRLCLKTASVRDSMVVIDHKGGEALNSRGDCLLKTEFFANEIRGQVAYTSDKDIENVVKSISSK